MKKQYFNQNVWESVEDEKYFKQWYSFVEHWFKWIIIHTNLPSEQGLNRRSSVVSWWKFTKGNLGRTVAKHFKNDIPVWERNPIFLIFGNGEIKF